MVRVFFKSAAALSTIFSVALMGLVQAQATTSEQLCLQEAERAVFSEFDRRNIQETPSRVQKRILTNNKSTQTAEIYVHLATFDIEGRRGSHHFVVSTKADVAGTCRVLSIQSK